MTDELIPPLNPLPAEDRAAVQSAQGRRARFARSHLGALVRELDGAVDEYLELRRQGVTREDACRGFEPILRGFFRVRPRHSCGYCDDVGWRQKTCTHGMRCGRYHCSRAEPSYEHTYVEPCECPAGDRMREPAQTPETELEAVGKPTKKKGGFTKVGRR